MGNPDWRNLDIWRTLGTNRDVDPPRLESRWSGTIEDGDDSLCLRIAKQFPDAPAWYLRTQWSGRDPDGARYYQTDQGMAFKPVRIWPFPWAPVVMNEQKEDSVKQLEGLFARLGAKSVLREFLISVFPPHHTYVEPFAGSFKVLLWKKTRSKIEIVNDADNYMINFWRHTQYMPEELAEAINMLPTSEAIFHWFHDDIRSMTSFQQAVAFYYVARLSFNGIIRAKGQTYASSPHTPPSHRVNVKALAETSLRLKGVDIRCNNYDKVIQTANKQVPGGVFFYLDPPYYKTYGYSTFTEGLDFALDEHKSLRDLCKQIDETGNRFIQTNSNHDDVKRLYKDFICHEREVYYSVSGSADKRGEAKELIISNFELTENTKQGVMF